MSEQVSKDDAATQKFLQRDESTWRVTEKLENFLGRADEFAVVFYVGGWVQILPPQNRKCNDFGLTFWLTNSNLRSGHRSSLPPAHQRVLQCRQNRQLSLPRTCSALQSQTSIRQGLSRWRACDRILEL
jgi:hypothetical protein